MPILSQAGTKCKITFGVFKGSPPSPRQPSHLVLQIHYRLLPPMSPTTGPYVPAAKIIFHQSATNGRRVRPTLPSAISWAWVLPVGWAQSPLAETCPAREQSAPPHHHVHTLRALSPTLQSRSRGSMSGGGSGSWCRQEGTAVDFQRVISSEGDRDGGEAMAQRDAGSQPSRVPPDQGEGWRWCWMPWRRLGSLPVPLSPRSKIPSIGPLSAHPQLAIEDWPHTNASAIQQLDCQHI